MQAIFNAITFAVILDSHESENGAVIELTLEASGKFGVYYRVGPFAYTIEFDDELDAVANFLAAVEIEEFAAAIRRILMPRMEFLLIAL